MGNPFLQATYHLNTIEAAQYITLAFVGLGIGSPLLGWIADRLNRRMDIMITATFLSFITLTLLLRSLLTQPHPSQHLIVIIWIRYWWVHVRIHGSQNAQPHYGSSHRRRHDQYGDALFGAITEPLVGFLLDQHHTSTNPTFSTHDFQYGLAILPVYLLIAVACAIWAKVYTTQNQQPSVDNKHTDHIRYAPS